MRYKEERMGAMIFRDPNNPTAILCNGGKLQFLDCEEITEGQGFATPGLGIVSYVMQYNGDRDCKVATAVRLLAFVPCQSTAQWEQQWVQVGTLFGRMYGSNEGEMVRTLICFCLLFDDYAKGAYTFLKATGDLVAMIGSIPQDYIGSSELRQLVFNLVACNLTKLGLNHAVSVEFAGSTFPSSVYELMQHYLRNTFASDGKFWASAARPEEYSRIGELFGQHFATEQQLPTTLTYIFDISPAVKGFEYLNSVCTRIALNGSARPMLDGPSSLGLQLPKNGMTGELTREELAEFVEFRNLSLQRPAALSGRRALPATTRTRNTNTPSLNRLTPYTCGGIPQSNPAKSNAETSCFKLLAQFGEQASTLSTVNTPQSTSELLSCVLVALNGNVQMAESPFHIQLDPIFRKGLMNAPITCDNQTAAKLPSTSFLGSVLVTDDTVTLQNPLITQSRKNGQGTLPLHLFQAMLNGLNKDIYATATCIAIIMQSMMEDGLFGVSAAWDYLVPAYASSVLQGDLAKEMDYSVALLYKLTEIGEDYSYKTRQMREDFATLSISLVGLGADIQGCCSECLYVQPELIEVCHRKLAELCSSFGMAKVASALASPELAALTRRWGVIQTFEWQKILRSFPPNYREDPGVPGDVDAFGKHKRSFLPKEQAKAMICEPAPVTLGFEFGHSETIEILRRSLALMSTSKPHLMCMAYAALCMLTGDLRQAAEIVQERDRAVPPEFHVFFGTVGHIDREVPEDVVCHKHGEELAMEAAMHIYTILSLHWNYPRDYTQARDLIVERFEGYIATYGQEVAYNLVRQATELMTQQKPFGFGVLVANARDGMQ